MKILKDSIIRDRYDVIVVGAGMGGLTAAALLAKKGVRVLVIEQHYLPGGNCSAIRRQDVTMDIAAAMLFGFGEKGYNPPRFIMNEIEEEIDIITHDSIYRMQLDGHRITFWRDMDRFLDELTAAYPHQDRELRAFYAELKKFYDIMIMNNKIPVPPTEVPLVTNMLNSFRHPIGTFQMVNFLFKSEEQIIKKYITDPKVITLFDLLTATYTCCNTQESPAILAATMFIDNHVGGACYPSGGPQTLPNLFEKAIEKNGGQVIYNEMVHEILIWNKKAYGVRLKNGTEITADRVISNATVWNLYGKLINRKHVSLKQKRWAESLESTKGGLLLYLSVNAEAIPEGTMAIEMLAGNPYDLEYGENYVIYIPSLDDPSIAPPGKHSMSIICPFYVKWPAIDDRYYQSDDYCKLKEEVAERCLDDLERMYFPDLKKNIITMDIGTPSTFERFTLRNNGCIGGPKLTMKQNFFNRLRARSEWKNLYCAGDSTSMGEGVISAMVSGVGAANEILKDMGFSQYIYRDFKKQYVNLTNGKPWTPPPAVSEPVTEFNASRASKECQHCEKPGCAEACPAGISAHQFARRIETKNYIGASRYLRGLNPLMEICGCICPSERFCEKSCNRHDFSASPVRIRDLHAWVCGKATGHDGWERFVDVQNGIKVAVIGAGPAGLTAGHYLARLGYSVDIYDKLNKPGGMMSHCIPSCRLGDDILSREIGDMTLPGMNYKFGMELGKDIMLDELRDEYPAIFIAPGLWSGRTLDNIGSGAGNITDALSFLKSARAGSKPATGENVLVIGGGSVASDAAITAKQLGASNVTVVCLEKREEMPCLPSEVVELEREGIKIENSWGPACMDRSGRISFDCCVSVFDDEKKFNPRFDSNRKMEFEYDQLIVAIGQRVENLLAAYLKTELRVSGLIPIIKETMQVKGHPGIYAGGDIIRGAGTVVEAVADGRKAAAAIDKYIKSKINTRLLGLAESNGKIITQEKAAICV